MRGGWSWSRPGHGLADRVRDGVLLRDLDGNFPVTMHYKFQQPVQMTVVVLRLQFIDRVGHCSYVTETGTVCYCAENRQDSMGAVLRRVGNARLCATTGAGVLTVLFL